MKAEKYKIKSDNGAIERIRFTNLTNKEIVSFGKLNANVMFIGTDDKGYNIGALQLRMFTDDGKTGKRDFWFETYDTKTDKKIVKKSSGTVEEVMSMISHISTHSKDISIIMNKKDYDKYTELITCFKNINNDVLKHCLYFGYEKDKSTYLGIYELRYTWISGKPRVRYFFRDNRSLLTFDKNGFNIEKRPDMTNISDILCG